TVKLDKGHVVPARIIASDESLDLALLKVEGAAFQPVTLADSDNVRLGDSLIIIGNPLGLDASVTTGILSGRDRLDRGWLQTNALINPGNSGGPAFDECRRAVGIAVAASPVYPGLNFLVPSNQAIQFLKSIK